MLRNHWATAALLLALASSCRAPTASFNEGAEIQAVPQRPTYSSNTYTTAPETLQLELGASLDPDDAAAMPTTLRYGFDERNELFADVSPITAVEGAGVGVSDLFVGWRQRWADPEGEQLGLAWQGTLKFPTGDEDKGLGTGEFDAFFAGISTLQQQDWSATGYLQFGLLGSPTGSGVDPQYGLAAAADRSVAANTAVFGELAGVFTPDQNSDIVFTTLGGVWSPTPGLALDAALRIGLSSDAPDLEFVIGFTRNLGRASGYAPRSARN